MSGVIAGVATGLQTAMASAIETVKTEAGSIIANLISILKVVMMYVYNWMRQFWDYFASNPIGGMTLLANFWVLAT
ncbi:hypothetical protein KAX02_07465 [candidate division WOR-3 bacterium]|nr:hypothetical protein [candidate division WOR-3 bacterium]